MPMPHKLAQYGNYSANIVGLFLSNLKSKKKQSFNIVINIYFSLHEAEKSASVNEQFIGKSF